MDKGRGGYRGFRPFRGRGFIWGGERGRSVFQGRGPFRPFFIRKRASPRGGQSFQGNRQFSEDVHNRMQERNREQDRSGELERDGDEGRHSQDSSDLESVSSEYDASSARYSQNMETSRQHSSSSKTSPSEKLSYVNKFKERELMRRREVDPRRDMTLLSDSLSRQSLNETSELPLVLRRGRMGHIQKGLPRSHRPGGRDIHTDVSPMRHFSSRAKRFDSGSHRGSFRRNDSRGWDKVAYKEPKVKKQQASWIPLDEEEGEKEKTSGVQSPDKKKRAVSHRDHIRDIQSKVVISQTGNGASPTTKSVKEVVNQMKKDVLGPKETFAELSSDKESSDQDGQESSKNSEGKRNSSSSVDESDKSQRNQKMKSVKPWMQESPQQILHYKEANGVKRGNGTGHLYEERNEDLDVISPRREHVSRHDVHNHGKRSGSLDRDQYTFIGLERYQKKSLSEESQYCRRTDDYEQERRSTSPDIDSLRIDFGKTHVNDENGHLKLDGNVRRFPLSDKSELYRSLIDSVKSRSEEGDNLYRSENASPFESSRNGVHKEISTHSLKGPVFGTREVRDEIIDEKLTNNSSFSGKDVERDYQSSSCWERNKVREYSDRRTSPYETGKLQLKECAYGMLDTKESMHMCKSGSYQSLPWEMQFKERTECDHDRAEFSDRYRPARRQRSHNTLGRNSVDKQEYDCDRADSSKRFPVNEGDSDHGKSSSRTFRTRGLIYDNEGFKSLSKRYSVKDCDSDISMSSYRARRSVDSGERLDLWEVCNQDRRENEYDETDPKVEYMVDSKRQVRSTSSEKYKDRYRRVTSRYDSLNKMFSAAGDSDHARDLKYSQNRMKERGSDQMKLDFHSGDKKMREYEKSKFSNTNVVNEKGRDYNTSKGSSFKMENVFHNFDSIDDHKTGKGTENQVSLDISEMYSLIDSDSEHGEKTLPRRYQLNCADSRSPTKERPYRRRQESYYEESDASRSSFESESDREDNGSHMRKKKGSYHRSRPQEQYRQRESTSDSSESDSRSESQNGGGSSDCLRKKNNREHIRLQSSESWEDSVYSRTDSVESYSRRRGNSHSRSNSRTWYTTDGSDSDETSDSGDKSTDHQKGSDGYRSNSMQSYTRSRKDTDEDHSHSSERYYVKKRHSKLDQSDSFWNMQAKKNEGSSSRERYREIRSSGGRFSDEHRSKEGSRPNPFKSPLKSIQKECERPVKKSSFSSVSKSKNYPLPKPSVGYGRHIYSSLSHSQMSRSRSQSRSVSVARSKISFYEKFKIKSKLWLKAQEEHIKEAEKKLIQESISKPSSKESGQGKESSGDLVKATESLKITVEQVKRIRTDLEGDPSKTACTYKDAVILQEHIKLSKYSRTEVSPSQNQFEKNTIVEKDTKPVHSSVSDLDVTDARGETASDLMMLFSKGEISYEEKSNEKQTIRVSEKTGKNSYRKSIPKQHKEAEEWTSRQIFVEHSISSVPLDSAGKAVPENPPVKDKKIEQSKLVDGPSRGNGAVGTAASKVELKSPNSQKKQLQNVQGSINFPGFDKRKIPQKSGIKVLLAGRNVSHVTSSPKRSFWNDRQRRKVNKGFQFSPVKKTTVSEVKKSISKGDNSTDKLTSVPVSTIADQKHSEHGSKEETHQEKHVGKNLTALFLKEESVDPQSPLSCQALRTHSKIVTESIFTPAKSYSQQMTVDMFDDDFGCASTELEASKIKMTAKTDVNSALQSTTLKQNSVPLSPSLEKSYLLAGTPSVNTNFSPVGENKSVSEKSPDEGSCDKDNKISATNTCTSQELGLVVKTVSEKSDISLMRSYDKTETCHSDHEEIDMELDDEEPDVSLEEDTSWMGEGQNNCSSFSTTPSYFNQISSGLSSMPPFPAYRPWFGPPAYSFQYFPVRFPPPPFTGYWPNNPTQCYGSQHYSSYSSYQNPSCRAQYTTCLQGENSGKSSQEVTFSVLQNVPKTSQQSSSAVTSSSQSQSLVTQNASSNLQAVSAKSEKDASEQENLSQLSSLVQSTTESSISAIDPPVVHLSEIPFPVTETSAIQPPKDQKYLSVSSPAAPKEIPVPKLVVPPLPEETYLFPVSDSLSFSQHNNPDPLLVSAPIKSSVCVTTSYMSVSLTAPVSIEEPTPVNTLLDHVSQPKLSLLPKSTEVPLPVSPVKDSVCLPVPPPKETRPVLVSPPGKSVTLPILPPGEPLQSLMPAPVPSLNDAPALVKSKDPVMLVSLSQSTQGTVPLPVTALMSQPCDTPPAPVQPPQKSPTAIVQGSSGLFRKDVISSLIPPLQHLPLNQDVSMQQIPVPVPVPHPQQWLSPKTSSVPDAVTENPAPIQPPVPSAQQSLISLSPITVSPVGETGAVGVDLCKTYGPKSKPSPVNSPKKSPNMHNAEGSKQSTLQPLLGLSSKQTESMKQNEDKDIRKPFPNVLVPAVPPLNKSMQKPLTKVKIVSEECQHRTKMLMTKVLPAVKTLIGTLDVGDMPCKTDSYSNISDPRPTDPSTVNVPKSALIHSRDPRLQKQTFEKLKAQNTEMFHADLDDVPAKTENALTPTDQPQSKVLSERLTQSRPQSLKTKQKTSNLDAQSKCLKQLKSILKSSLAKSGAQPAVPKSKSKAKTSATESFSQTAKLPINIPQFDPALPKSTSSSMVPSIPTVHKHTLPKPQFDPDCDYSDVPMDIDVTENSDRVSNSPELPESQPFIVTDQSVIHGAPVSIPTSLPHATASNTASFSIPPNKPPRDPRLEKKHEAETRMVLKTLFKALQKSVPAKTSAVSNQRSKPVVKTSKPLQTHDKSSQGAPTGLESNSQTFGIVRTPDSKTPVDVVNPRHSQEDEVSESSLKPRDLFPERNSKASATSHDSGLCPRQIVIENRKKSNSASTAPFPSTSFHLPETLSTTAPIPTVIPGKSTGGSSGENILENPNPLIQTSEDDEVTPASGLGNEYQVLSARSFEHEGELDRAESDYGKWLAESPVPKEPASITSVNPQQRSSRSFSDQGILAPPQGSSVSDAYRSPVYPSTSEDMPDTKCGSLSARTLSYSSDSQGPLTKEKVRGLSHKDVSEWVKNSSAQCLMDPEASPQSHSHSHGKKRHGEKKKKKHHSGSSRVHNSGSKTELSEKSLGKSPKGSKSDMRRFLSNDASPRSREEYRTKLPDVISDDSFDVPECGDVDTPDIMKTPSKSPFYLDSSKLSKFKSNLSKSPAIKTKLVASSSSSSSPAGGSKSSSTPSRWGPEISNPLGSYRIPKLTASSDTESKDVKKKKDEETSKQGVSKSQDDSLEDVSSESDDDLFNETPAFLKEFEETSKAILAAGMTPGTPDNNHTESVHSDDSLVLDEPTVSYKPAPKSAESKSTFSLDALLAEKVENEETDRELNHMQKELKEGIKQGGFVRLAEAGVEDSDDDLLPEHHQKLQYFQVSENTIQDQHPGEVVLHPGKFPCLYSEVLSPARCGFKASESFLEKHLAKIHPDALTDLLTTDMLSICFHKIKSQEEVLRWIFFIMSVHHDSCVIQGCKKLVFDIIHTQLSVDETSNTWAPSILDILKVLVNFGGDSSDLLQARTLYSLEEVRDVIIPENDNNLTFANDNNFPVRSYAENIREFLQTVAFALQGRPKYSATELNVLLVMMAKTSLEKEFTDNVLLYEFSVVLSSILVAYQEEDWNTVMPNLCHQLSEITSHHHNFVYLAQLFPHGKRGSSIQRRLAYLLLMKMLQPDTRVTREQLVDYKLRQLSAFFPTLRDLAADDLYALSSAVALLDIAVGNEPLKGSEKNDLQFLMELLRTLTSDVRDNVRRLDHTRVKDLMVRISSKWTVTLQTTTSKQRNLFAWTKQKSPQKMQVQRLETGASDVESDDEDEDEEEMEEDPGDGAPGTAESFPVLMEAGVGPSGDTNTITVEAEDRIDVEIDSEDTSEESPGASKTCIKEHMEIDNVNNNADVASDAKEETETSVNNGVTISSEVRVVLEDICIKCNSKEEEDGSTDEESLPELDIAL